MKKLRIIWEIFIIFLKIGSFTFGGGLAMLPLIHREVVDKRKWVSEEEIVDIFAISQSVPGVISINAAIFIGNKLLGITGATVAALGLILPAFVSILLVVSVLSFLSGNAYVEKVFTGIGAASAGMILLAANKLGKSAIKEKTGYIIAAVSFIAVVLFNIHAAWAIVFGGAFGLCSYWFKRKQEAEK